MSEAVYTPSHIANYFLEKAAREGLSISQMKLLKLVYIAYGWVIALTGERLFSESIEAWQHGPVIRSLYDEFKHYGSSDIEELSMEYDLDEQKFYTPRIDSEQDDVRAILGKVWDIYKHFTASSLRNKTHESGTPWDQTIKAKGLNSIIDPELIREHFRDRIKHYIAAAA